MPLSQPMTSSQRGQSLVVQSPAKLNLFLEVLGVRSDGFHELETLMVTVGIFDTLSFTEEVSGRIRLRCSGAAAVALADFDSSSADNTGGDNLVVKAAHLLRKHSGTDRGVRIKLFKRIPLESGLAGGSSNAAATLMALNRLWRLDLPAAELQQLAAQLGSDVGFFLGDKPAAVCRGRGEVVEPLCVPAGLHFVVVRPPSGLSTAAVYRRCKPALEPSTSSKLAACLRQGRLADAGQCLYNALQPPAEEINPDVAKLRTEFAKLPVLGHQMSGSGSAYFGLCGNRRQAKAIAGRLRSAGLGRVFVAQSGPQMAASFVDIV
jgi:4-diphosphocytidyl-2-C-methyl-D-erythritol kinase